MPDNRAKPDAQSDHGSAPPVDGALHAELLAQLSALWFDIDHRGGAKAHHYFTADARLRFEGAVFTGTEEIGRVYAERSARGPRVSRHLLTNLTVLEAQPTRVRAISNLLLFAEDGNAPRPNTFPAMVGDVVDELERHDGRWLISSRWIQYLFIDPATQLAVPGAPRATVQGGTT